ncbi:MAG: GatB/YqeY domain-containing protein [Rhodobacteraceae bacterium]|nr:GatB/YqeY domain-containing protein [Paracoccaceae bacterium]
MLRERFSTDLKEAIKAKDPQRVSTLRLITAAIKDRDIAARSEDNIDGVSDAEILAILGKMIKQRQDSARAYEEGGRLDLAEQERGEIRIIKDYLPRQMTEDEVRQAISRAIAETGAASIRDMGRVMAELKSRHPGKMDFARASAAVKEAFS